MPAWLVDAACSGLPVEWWFPPRGDRGRLAHAICATCCVRDACLDAALAEEVGTTARRFGIRGGVTARDRNRLRPDVALPVVPVLPNGDTPTEPRVVQVHRPYVVAL